MATESEDPLEEANRLAENLSRIEALSARLATALARRRVPRPSLEGPGPELYAKAMTAWMTELMTDPARLYEHQVEYWARTLKHMAEAQAALAHDPLTGVPEDPGPDDPRFSSPAWNQNPWLNFIKQQYLITAESLEEALDDLEGLDPHERERVRYFARQAIDMLAPPNFLATNPEALARAIETEGESLVRGLENLVEDLEAHDGELVVTLADPEAFELGRDLATTPGEVVFRNRLFELIMYAPATERVHTTPLLIFPPWINKFYVLDLRPENSLVRWLVGQGFTVFMVSWVNPDESYADVGIDTYVEEGYLTAIDEVKAICNVRRINATGYCIGGTTLALTLALMHKRGDRSVKSASFFTTLTDFTDPGEVRVFLDDDFVDGIEREVTETGMLDSLYMARTFSFLRPNDLIYKPAVRRYMLGEPPPAFDLLFWNGDATNVPGRFAVEYLRLLCQKNSFVEGGIELLGETVSIDDIRLPLCSIACETDHIAPWASCYKGVRAMPADEKTFVLSQSGHIAGIVNPPTRNKYDHYLNPAWPEAPEDWRAGARQVTGSWWPDWGEWVRARSGKLRPARPAAGRDGKSLGPAPGTYVLKKGGRGAARPPSHGSQG